MADGGDGKAGDECKSDRRNVTKRTKRGKRRGCGRDERSRGDVGGDINVRAILNQNHARNGSAERRRTEDEVRELNYNKGKSRGR